MRNNTADIELDKSQRCHNASCGRLTYATTLTLDGCPPFLPGRFPPGATRMHEQDLVQRRWFRRSLVVDGWRNNDDVCVGCDGVSSARKDGGGDAPNARSRFIRVNGPSSSFSSISTSSPFSLTSSILSAAPENQSTVCAGPLRPFPRFEGTIPKR